MAANKGRDGPQREDMRDRLRALGVKARHDTRSLTLEDLDVIVTLVSALAPTHLIPPEGPSGSVEAPFEPVAPDTPHLEVQAQLRQAHAMEYIAFQLGELVRLKEEERSRERWRPAPIAKDRSS